MLQSQLPDFAALRGELSGNGACRAGDDVPRVSVPPNGNPAPFDFNSLVLANMDPNLNANAAIRSMYMNSLAQISGGSPSPASSAPSSASEAHPTSVPTSLSANGDATPPATTETTSAAAAAAASIASSIGGGSAPMPPWFASMLPQQPTPTLNSLLEQMNSAMPALLSTNPMALAAALAGGAAPSLTPTTTTAAASLLQQVAHSPTKSTSDSTVRCALCSKDFCNPSFLRSHMAKKHGIGSEDESPLKSGSPQNGTAFPFIPSTSAGASVIVNGHDDSPRKAEPMDDDDDNDHKPNDFLLRSASSTTPCDECGREFPNFFDMLTHKARDHLAEAESMARCGECNEKFDSQDLLSQHVAMAHNPGLARSLLSGLLPPGFQNFPFLLPQGLPGQFPGLDALDPTNPLSVLQTTPKSTPNSNSQKRTYASNGKNYCDLCNKEVCNKYFLRTHMLKMHGIVIDENKVVIANIDTAEKERLGGLTFRCDLCMVELKTRQQLRQHKQEAHGVTPLSTPQRAPKPPAPVTPTSQPLITLNGTQQSLLEKCLVCDKRVPPPQLPSHMAHEHPTDIPAQLLAQIKGFNQQQQQQQNFGVTCKFCPMRAKEESELQLHMITNHPTELLAVAITTESTKKDEVHSCHRCPYQTKIARNLEMHLERHERLNEVKASEDDDEALKITREVALQMANLNKQLGLDARQPAVPVSMPTPAVAAAADSAMPPPPPLKSCELSGPVKCSRCKRHYSSRETLAEHVRSVHRSLPADLLPLTVRRKLSALRSAKKAPFPCAKCTRRFYTQDDVLNHFLSHLKDAETAGSAIKDEHAAQHNNDGHSHTSGSASPLSTSLPEAFVRPASQTTLPLTMQTVVLKIVTPLSTCSIPQELICNLPVRSTISSPLSVTFELTPHSQQPSPTDFAL